MAATRPPPQGSNMDVFEAFFKRADLGQNRRINGSEAVAFFQGSNLPKHVLAQVQGQLSLLCGSVMTFGLINYLYHEFELMAEELLMSNSIIKESSVIHSNANLGVHGQGLLNLTGKGDIIEAQRLILSLFYSVNGSSEDRGDDRGDDGEMPSAAERGDISEEEGSSGHSGDDDNDRKDVIQSVEESDSYEDEVPPKNTIGEVPLKWYEEEEQIRYDIKGKKIRKQPRKDKLQSFLEGVDDSKNWT